MRRSVIIYGLALAALLILLKWMEWHFLVYNHAIELYSGALAILFTSLGIWLALKLAKPKIRTVIVERPTPARVPAPETPSPETPETAKASQGLEAADIDSMELTRLGISSREQEVLQLLAQGLSNQEIADRLFVSLNTIKTHCSRIFEKLDVKRRTQAIDTAKRLKLIR